MKIKKFMALVLLFAIVCLQISGSQYACNIEKVVEERHIDRFITPQKTKCI